MLSRDSLLILAGLAASACSPLPKHPVPVAVLVGGNAQALARLPSVDGLALRRVELPAPSLPPSDAGEATLAAARTAYAAGELDSCRAELGKLDLVTLLANRMRTAAARGLVLDVACAWAAADKSAAAAIAERLAVFGLEIPDVAISPDAERVIGTAVTKSGTQPRVALTIEGVAGASVALDGRDASCTLPCTIDVVAGDHVVAVESDGYERASKLVRVESAMRVALNQRPAPPALAAAQWRARTSRGFPPTDTIGAALIGKLAGNERVAYVHAGSQLDGAMIVSGKAVARAQRSRDDSAGVIRELAYDSGILARPTVWQRPTTWIVVSALALVAAGVIVYAVYEPDPTTRLVTP